MSEQWNITEMEDALSKLPNPPAKSRYCYDRHGFPNITMTVKIRGDQYVKAKINGLDITNTLSKLFDNLFNLDLPIHEFQKRLDEVIEEFATLEKNRKQSTFYELEENDRKKEIISSAFTNVNPEQFKRYLPEIDTENNYANWWNDTACKINDSSDIKITVEDLLKYVRGATDCNPTT